MLFYVIKAFCILFYFNIKNVNYDLLNSLNKLPMNCDLQFEEPCSRVKNQCPQLKET